MERSPLAHDTGALRSVRANLEHDGRALAAAPVEPEDEPARADAGFGTRVEEVQTVRLLADAELPESLIDLVAYGAAPRRIGALRAVPGA
jgi:hypothetical protein